jgi:hypothetical protein
MSLLTIALSAAQGIFTGVTFVNPYAWVIRGVIAGGIYGGLLGVATGPVEYHLKFSRHYCEQMHAARTCLYRSIWSDQADLIHQLVKDFFQINDARLSIYHCSLGMDLMIMPMIADRKELLLIPDAAEANYLFKHYECESIFKYLDNEAAKDEAIVAANQEIIEKNRSRSNPLPLLRRIQDEHGRVSCPFRVQKMKKEDLRLDIDKVVGLSKEMNYFLKLIISNEPLEGYQEIFIKLKKLASQLLNFNNDKTDGSHTICRNTICLSQDHEQQTHLEERERGILLKFFKPLFDTIQKRNSDMKEAMIKQLTENQKNNIIDLQQYEREKSHINAWFESNSLHLNSIGPISNS